MSRNRLVDALIGAGVTAAAELRRRLGVSPATLSRLVGEAGDTVLRMGRGRSVSYAGVRTLPGLPPRIPVYRVDADGDVTPVAEIVALDGGATWVAALDGAGHTHVGLPPVVHDMAPSGYLGRRFSETHADLGLPSRVQDWSDDHRLVAVARRGEDCLGDLIIGEESLQRHLDRSPVIVSESDYPRLAEAAVRGAVGSSAGGEQPKATAYCDGRHVIVKFTPGDGSPSDVRWRDLLVCELLALEVLAAHGIATPSARVLEGGGRRFLDVQRFDRNGARGRIGVLSLGPLDDELSGGRDTWSKAAARLHAAKLLDVEDLRRVRLLEAFAILIANGDRHFGNVTFFADGLSARPRLRLAPVYDMLPMSFAPSAGVVPPVARPASTPRAELLDVWPAAAGLAMAYWDAVATDQRVSAGFRDSVKIRS